MKYSQSFLAFLIFVIPFSLFADFSWETVNPNPPAVGYEDIAYGEGVWVAVGGNVMATTADEGATWTSVNTGGGNDFFDGILYTGTRFYAYGQQQLNNIYGVMLFESEDGYTWARVDPSRVTASGNADKQRLLDGAVSDDGQSIVIGGFQGAYYRSSNGGDTWTASIYLPDDPSGHAQFGLIIGSVAYGNNAFVFIQNGNEENGLIINTSTDGGVTWNYNPTGAPLNPDSIGFGNGEFLIIGSEAQTFQNSALKSTDGINWTTTVTNRTGGLIYELDYSLGSWVGTPAWPTDIVTSTDGLTWTTLSGSAGSSSFRGLGVKDDRIVVVGYGNMKTSTDAQNWINFTPGEPAGNLSSAAYGNGAWVAVGETGTILTSTDDGFTWTSTGPGTVTLINDIIWDGTQFIAVGQKVWTSSDGIDWTESSFGVTTSMNAIAYGKGRYVAAGGTSQVLWSEDGNTWNNVTLPATTDPNDLIYADGNFILVGESRNWPDPSVGQVLVSTDGETWTEIGPDGFRGFKTVAYGNGICVVIGENEFFGRSTVLVSTDLSNWIDSSLNADPGGIFFDGASFINVGSLIASSVDGLIWNVVEDNPGTPYVNEFSYDNNTVFALGDSGAIHRSSLVVEFVLPSIFVESNDIGNDWFDSTWFGLFSRPIPQENWIYHAEMGWLWIEEPGDSLWLWNSDWGWLYTLPTLFPYLYDSHDQAWMVWDGELKAL